MASKEGKTTRRLTTTTTTTTKVEEEEIHTEDDKEREENQTKATKNDNDKSTKKKKKEKEHHTKSDPDDVKRGNKIKQLQEHSEVLKKMISDVEEARNTTCDQVDNHIANICKTAKKMGETMKKDAKKIGKDEISKLTKLVEDVAKITAVYKDKDGLKDVQTKTDYNISTNLQKPVVRHPCYSMVEVDVDCLKRLLGEVETRTTFTRSFSLDKVKQGTVYNSDPEIIQGLPWIVRCKLDKSTLDIYLILTKVADKTIKTVKASYSVKLVNINDASKSEVQQDKCKFNPGGHTGSCPVSIDWSKLQDAKYGFIDADNKIFTVEASVYIIDIER